MQSGATSHQRFMSRRYYAEQRPSKTEPECSELSNKADALPNNLSGGEQQRVNLARAFAYLAARTQNNALLLLDEPFASQDEENAQNIQSLIKEMLFMQKKSALIISHDKTMLGQICGDDDKVSSLC